MMSHPHLLGLHTESFTLFLLYITSATSDNTPCAFGEGIADTNQDPLKLNPARGTVCLSGRLLLSHNLCADLIYTFSCSLHDMLIYPRFSSLSLSAYLKSIRHQHLKTSTKAHVGFLCLGFGTVDLARQQNETLQCGGLSRDSRVEKVDLKVDTSRNA